MLAVEVDADVTVPTPMLPKLNPLLIPWVEEPATMDAPDAVNGLVADVVAVELLPKLNPPPKAGCPIVVGAPSDGRADDVFVVRSPVSVGFAAVLAKFPNNAAAGLAGPPEGLNENPDCCGVAVDADTDG